MFITEYMETLKHRPDHHKRRFAVAASGVITASIFLAWLSVILPSNSSRIVANTTQVQKVESSTTVSPLENLRRGTAQAYEAMRSAFVKTSEVNLQENYTKMRTQVETGQIKLTPTNSTN